MGICDSLCSGCFGDFYVWVCRVWGLATVIGLWGIGVEVSFYGHYLGYYLLAVASLLTILEVAFAVNYVMVLCLSADSSCKTCWDWLLWLDDWKKASLYLVLSVPCFVQPFGVWLAVIAGIMLIVSGLFYLLKSFKTNLEKDRIKIAQTASYDKFDDLQDDIEDDGDDIITGSARISIMDDDIGDQQEILEV